MTNTLRSPTVASHPWTSTNHPINANPPPQRTMAISHSVIITGPTFGNFKKKTPASHSERAGKYTCNDPDPGQEKGLQGGPRMGVSIIGL